MDDAQRSPVRLQTDVGPLTYPADDVIAPWVQAYSSWEREEASALREIAAPGMTCVDLGAHVGYHTLVLARAVGPSGHVWAVEPDARNFDLLRQNIAENGVANVTVVQAAAWRHGGQLTLSRSSVNSGDHRVSEPASERPGVTVPAVTIDELLPPHCNVGLVKSDLQGRDHVAIEGMARTIARSRPAMVVEFWPRGIRELGDDPAAVVAYYRRLGYRIAILGQADTAASGETITADADSATGEFVTLLLRPSPPSSANRSAAPAFPVARR